MSTVNNETALRTIDLYHDRIASVINRRMGHAPDATEYDYDPVPRRPRKKPKKRDPEQKRHTRPRRQKLIPEPVPRTYHSRMERILCVVRRLGSVDYETLQKQSRLTDESLGRSIGELLQTRRLRFTGEGESRRYYAPASI